MTLSHDWAGFLLRYYLYAIAGIVIRNQVD